MSAPENLLLKATPALLDGWCGPAVLRLSGADLPCAVLAPCPFSPGRVVLAILADLAGRDPRKQYTHPPWRHKTSAGDVYLDLSRAECRDRVARVLGHGSEVRCALGTAGTDEPPSLQTGDTFYPWPSGIDPNDDTRLPDGSRLADALALLCVAQVML